MLTSRISWPEIRILPAIQLKAYEHEHAILRTSVFISCTEILCCWTPLGGTPLIEPFFAEGFSLCINVSYEIVMCIEV